MRVESLGAAVAASGGALGRLMAQLAVSARPWASWASSRCKEVSLRLWAVSRSRGAEISADADRWLRKRLRRHRWLRKRRTRRIALFAVLALWAVHMLVASLFISTQDMEPAGLQARVIESRLKAQERAAANDLIEERVQAQIQERMERHFADLRNPSSDENSYPTNRGGSSVLGEAENGYADNGYGAEENLGTENHNQASSRNRGQVKGRREEVVRNGMMVREFAEFEATHEEAQSPELQDQRKKVREHKDRTAAEMKAKADKLRGRHKFAILDETPGLASAIDAKTKTKSKHKQQQQHHHSEATQGLLKAAFGQLGYAEGLLSDGPLWLLAPGLECQGDEVSGAVNQVADLSSIGVFCYGDANWVSHLSRKDVLDQRLQWFDTKLHRHKDCIQYSDFVPWTFVVNPGTDLNELEQKAADQASNGNAVFIIKHQKPIDELTAAAAAQSLPAVTTQPVKAIKALRKRGHDMEGLIVQNFKTNPLLWEGRRFVVRTWAFIVSSRPFLALYHDGVILRSLDTEHAHFSSKQNAVRSRLVNITSRQREHPEFAQRQSEAFGCMDDFQRYLNGAFKNAEMLHYTDLVLKPYLKRLMNFALHALRREHDHNSPIWALQHLCFDFSIDANWNVWLLDASPSCDPQLGAPEFTSTCKRASIHALGTSAATIAEQVYLQKKANQRGSLLDHVDLGTFEVLFDSESSVHAHDVYQEVCKRSTYQDFRKRQTFGKRVVQQLLPWDGRLPEDFHHHDHDHDHGDPWKCPVCGYSNGPGADSCDYCGSPSAASAASAATKPQGHAVTTPAADHTVKTNDWSQEGRQQQQQPNMVTIQSNPGDSQNSVDSTTASGTADPLSAQEAWSNRISSTSSRFDATGRGVEDEMEAFLQRGDGPNSEDPSKHFPQPSYEVQVRHIMCAGKAFDIKESIEIVGFDIEPLRTSTYHACCSSCAINPQCGSFTYVADSFQCWLKTQGGMEGHQPGRISGTLSSGNGAMGITSTSGISSTSSNMGGGVPGGLSTGWNSQPSLDSQRTQMSPSSQMARRDYYRKKLIEIFSEHDPNKLNKVDALLDRYRGNEERFILRTTQQYEEIGNLMKARNAQRKSSFGSAGNGNTFTNANAGAGRYNSQGARSWQSSEYGGNGGAGTGNIAGINNIDQRDSHGLTMDDYRDRIRQILAKHDPSKLNDVEPMLRHFKGKEMQLVEFLMKKYK